MKSILTSDIKYTYTSSICANLNFNNFGFDTKSGTTVRVGLSYKTYDDGPSDRKYDTTHLVSSSDRLGTPISQLGSGANVLRKA